MNMKNGSAISAVSPAVVANLQDHVDWLTTKGWHITLTVLPMHKDGESSNWYYLHGLYKPAGIPDGLVEEIISHAEFPCPAPKGIFRSSLLNGRKDGSLTPERKWNSAQLKKVVEKLHSLSKRKVSRSRWAQAFRRYEKLMRYICQGIPPVDQTDCWNFSGVTWEQYDDFSRLVKHLRRIFVIPVAVAAPHSGRHKKDMFHDPRFDHRIAKALNSFRSTYQCRAYEFRRRIKTKMAPRGRGVYKTFESLAQNVNGQLKPISKEEYVGSLLSLELECLGYPRYTWKTALKIGTDAKRNVAEIRSHYYLRMHPAEGESLI